MIALGFIFYDQYLSTYKADQTAATYKNMSVSGYSSAERCRYGKQVKFAYVEAGAPEKAEKFDQDLILTCLNASSEALIGY